VSLDARPPHPCQRQHDDPCRPTPGIETTVIGVAPPTAFLDSFADFLSAAVAVEAALDEGGDSQLQLAIFHPEVNQLTTWNQPAAPSPPFFHAQLSTAAVLAVRVALSHSYLTSRVVA